MRRGWRPTPSIAAAATRQRATFDELWERVAGYSINLDPLTTQGPIVIKSNANSRHDGRVVIGPITRIQPGVVYQRFIDATVDHVFVESRPVIVGDRMPLTLESALPRPHWGARPMSTRTRRPSDLYSTAEVEQMLALASAIGLDYGELDVLRESATGQLFVSDVNPTPVRPHFMAPADELAAMRLMADAFAEVFGRA